MIGLIKVYFIFTDTPCVFQIYNKMVQILHKKKYIVYIFKVHFNLYIVFTDTPRHDIEEAFRGFLKRDDIAIILINQMVRL